MRFLEKISEVVATGFYSGLSPRAPGFCGTLFAAGLFFLAHKIFPMLQTWTGSLIFAFSVLTLALVSTHYTLKSNRFGNDDPQQIVIDEFAGYAFSLVGLPGHWFSFLLAFIFFRFFDVAKPTPARQLENIPGAGGIVFDDIAAGIYAVICCHLFYYLCPNVL